MCLFYILRILLGTFTNMPSCLLTLRLFALCTSQTGSKLILKIVPKYLSHGKIIRLNLELPNGLLEYHYLCPLPRSQGEWNSDGIQGRVFCDLM